MSQSMPAASQALQDAITETASEISFQKVLLSSIDDSVQNREAAEEEIRKEIKDLERKLKRLRHSTTAAASGSREAAASSQRTPEPPANRSPRREAVSGVTMNDPRNSVPWDQRSIAASSTASTPNSANNNLADYANPSYLDLPTRKRTYSTFDASLKPGGPNKSRRTSPSPFLTNPTTPTTSSSDDGGSPSQFDYLSQQRAEEDRLRQLKADEDFARSLQDADPEFPLFSPPLAGPSAFDRISGIRRHPQGSTRSERLYSKTHPSFADLEAKTEEDASSRSDSNSWMNTPRFNSSAKNEPSSSDRGFSAYSSMDGAGFGAAFKNEPLSTNGGFYGNASVQNGSSSYATKKQPFGSNCSSNPYTSTIKTDQFSQPRLQFDAELSDDSDDDIQIIPPSAFRDNGRHPQTSIAGPSSASPYDPLSVDNHANHALGRALYGQKGVPSWMNTSPPPPSMYTASTMGSMPKLEPGLGYGYNHYNTDAPGLSNYDTLGDIISRTNNNYDELQGYLGLDHTMTNQLDYIMNDPRKTNEEIKNLLENISADVELPPENREGTPDGLVYPLYEHQKLALTWLKSMEQGTNKGGILADDMGLGKTISALALILGRPSQDRAHKTTLIVGPVALIRQWEREIRLKIKANHRLSVCMVHGGKKPSWPELQVFDVVLTTYGTLAAELTKLEAFRQKHKNNPHYDQNPMKKDFPLLGPKSFFYRIILDEAQCIKNKNTKAARAACELHAEHRFCLTGTPMMNKIEELYSLIHFLRIKPYNQWPRFQADFKVLSKGTNGEREVQTAMRKLQAVLKSILMRRTKTSIIDGKPIITLPKKTEEIQHVVFDEDEQAFYTALETKTQIQFNKYLKAGTVGKHYSNILVLLLRLRQACCHPHLIHDFAEAPNLGAMVSPDIMLELAKGLSPDVIARILAADGAFECPVCYDAITNPRIVIPCGHDTCIECLTRITEQDAQQNVVHGHESGGASKCPTCRGNLELTKVIDYTTFKKVHMPEVDGAANEDTEDDDISTDNSDTDSDSDSEDDADSDGDLRDFVVPDDIEDDTVDEDETNDTTNANDDQSDVLGLHEASSISNSKINAKTKGNSKDKETRRRRKIRNGKKKEKKSVSLAQLKKEASRSQKNHRKYMKYLRKHWQPSAKVTKCVELLGKFQEEGHKTIIFSQFVSLLDMLQVPIEDNGWSCLRYDGSMSAEKRNHAINAFTENSTKKIMLISLKAGNAGLNLTAASRVIILDPFWNPFIEMQAVDRAYRIGQQKEVEVHRILIEKTVEDRIIELQEKKRKLVDAALDEGAGKQIGRLGPQELAFLFGVGGP